jgi:hypothetical protein
VTLLVSVSDERSHYVDDKRMYHREAVSLSEKYIAEMIVAG